ncbi:MAG: cytochrome c [Anaerolineae bacterium]
MNRISFSRLSLLSVLSLLLLAACSAPAPQVASTPGNSAGMGMGMGMGMASGMMERHRAQVPAPYAGLSSPVKADAESLTRGAAVFTANCATCHGDGGMGDGPAGVSLNPVPAAVAHTSQMMGDDYLFWRISEGGVSFTTAMPVWKEALTEQQRWDVINYVRALGRGDVKPGQAVGGAAYDPQAEAAQRAEVLAQSVAKGQITQAQADNFTIVHAALEDHMAASQHDSGSGNPAERQAAVLAELVQDGAITQAQADMFSKTHDLLHAAGLIE